MNCEVPGCIGTKEKEDVCAGHAGNTYRKDAAYCGHLIKGDAARPCVIPAGHTGRQHSDARQYARRLKGERIDHPRSRETITNDGVIDWLAIDLAVKGDRVPRMSWLERDIAAGILLSQGLRPPDIRGHLSMAYDPRRWERIVQIAESVKQEGYCARY